VIVVSRAPAATRPPGSRLRQPKRRLHVGVIPEVEDLFQRQARETDVKKREALVYQIQGILHDRVIQIPIYELAFIWGVGPASRSREST